MHGSGFRTSNEGKKKPETIEFYIMTKCGVDILDAMLKMYSCKVGSRRWPSAVFHNALDLALINSWIIFRKVTRINKSRR